MAASEGRSGRGRACTTQSTSATSSSAAGCGWRAQAPAEAALRNSTTANVTPSAGSRWPARLAPSARMTVMTKTAWPSCNARTVAAPAPLRTSRAPARAHRTIVTAVATRPRPVGVCPPAESARASASRDFDDTSLSRLVSATFPSDCRRWIPTDDDVAGPILKAARGASPRGARGGPTARSRVASLQSSSSVGAGREPASSPLCAAARRGSTSTGGGLATSPVAVVPSSLRRRVLGSTRVSSEASAWL